MFYVYVLLSLKDRKLYIVFTSKHPTERLKDHNSGGTVSTSPRKPFKLLYYEAHTSEKDARRREKYFKTDKGKSTIKLMLREGLASLPKPSSKPL